MANFVPVLDQDTQNRTHESYTRQFRNVRYLLNALHNEWLLGRGYKTLIKIRKNLHVFV